MKLMFTKRNFSYWNSRFPVTTVNEEHVFSSLMPVQDFELLGQQLSSGVWLLIGKWQTMLLPKLLIDMKKLDAQGEFHLPLESCTVCCYWYTTLTLSYCISMQAVALTLMQTPSLLNEAQDLNYFLALRNYSFYSRITPTDTKNQTCWLWNMNLYTCYNSKA